eukprot:1703614-Pyramimonas_sp.AAC.2
MNKCIIVSGFVDLLYVSKLRCVRAVSLPVSTALSHVLPRGAHHPAGAIGWLPPQALMWEAAIKAAT